MRPAVRALLTCAVLGLCLADPEKTVRWCTISTHEANKCASFRENMLRIFENGPFVSCVKKTSHMDCIKAISNNEADAVTLDGGLVYEAGLKPNNLKPVVAEFHGTKDNPQTHYYAVAVVKKGTDFNLNELKGKKSCHTGLGRSAGWNIPMGRLYKELPDPQESIQRAAASFFSASCVPCADQSSFPKLCQLCAGKGTDKCACSNHEPYFGYAGAFKCLAEGSGDVAFVKHSTVFDNLPNPDDRKDYELLCGDNTRKSVDDYHGCHLAKVPSHAVVARTVGGKEDVIWELLNHAQEHFGKDKPDNFQLFQSPHGKDLLFKDSADGFLKIPSKMDFELYLGYEYVTALQNLRESKPPDTSTDECKVKWCAIGHQERTKCDQWSGFSGGAIECETAENTEECIAKIMKGEADAMSLDGGYLYIAGKCGLVPVLAENYENEGTDCTNTPEKGYLAVAVVKASDADLNWNNLKGKKSCHTAVDRTAGWNIPMGLLYSKINNCKFDEYFSAGCAPGSQRNSSLCALCIGSEKGSGKECVPNSNERYYGYTGAFRCLVEKGDVAFVKDQTVKQNTDGNNDEAWAKDLKKRDFELLCKDGTRKAVEEAEKCYLARAPNHAVVSRKDKATCVEQILKEQQANFGKAVTDCTSNFCLFQSTSKDLLFRDDTKCLASIAKKTYDSYLGDDYVRAMTNLRQCSTSKLLEAEAEEQETGSLEESTDESEEEESEEEPKLKYERLSNGVTEILQKDAASCMTVHDKFLALGTHYGKVYLLDVQGNITQKFDVSPVKINQVSLDESGEHMGVCAEDGKVQVFGLYSGEEFHETFDCPIKIIAVHPHFVRSSCKQFVTGGKKLLLFERSWMSRWKSSVLHEGEGNIRSVKWRGHLIAWANNMGVKIFDITSKQRITNVPRDDISLRPDMYPCSLCWKDNVTLIIGWGTSVKICSVKERHASEMRDLPSRYVEIVSQFETEFYISGLAPLCDQLVVLSYVKEVSEKTEREYCARPRLDIIQPLSETCEEISSDALTVRGFQENECRDYHLEYSEGESLFYIVSPRDVVVAKERDQDDHIDWLLEKKKYEEALMAAEISQKNIKRHKILDIGLAYINHLVARGEYDIAARKCQKILGKNAALWEYEVYKFKEIGQLKAISPYLPRGDPVLKPLIYEMILHEFLESDYEGFATLIREWPGDLYNNSVIVQAVRDHLKKDSQNRTLLKTLAELYTYDKNYGNALEIYLTLRHKDVFQLIHKHNLFSSIKDKIVLLMDFDSEKAVDMLLDNEDKISIKKVVEELEDRPELQHVYLHKLFKRDHHKGQRYHEKQISLYAEFDRPNLLPFLRDSIHCPLEKALEICQQRNFVEETVYLLSRMGNSRSALKMIMEELHDVDKAIEFAKEQDDAELWEDLILYSIDKPPFITGLLNNIGTHVDPILLIHRIKEGMEIPNLRDSLVKILQDYNLQILLREGCKKILVADSLSLLKKMHRTQMKGILVDEENICESCLSPILPSDAAKPFSMVVFHCRHMFHKECLPVPSMTSPAQFCNICSAKHRGPGSAILEMKK